MQQHAHNYASSGTWLWLVQRTLFWWPLFQICYRENTIYGIKWACYVRWTPVQGSRLCIVDCSFRVKIIKELHQGHDQTLQLVSSSYYWPIMHKEVARFIERCRVCQLSKGKATNVGLYMLLLILTKPWSDVSMDFVLGLPRTQRGFDSTNVVHIAQLYFREVYRLHGLPTSIVSDRDTRFLSHFWHSLWKLVNTSLNFSSA